SIDVGKNSARRVLIGASHPGRIGYVLELPPAQVPVEFVAVLQPAKVEVAPAVPIHIATSNSRTVEPDLVFGDFVVGEHVGEGYPGRGWWQECETGPALLGDGQRCPAIAGPLLPAKVGGHQ